MGKPPAIRCGNARCRNGRETSKANVSGDDSMCHNDDDARILSSALKLHCSLAKSAGPVRGLEAHSEEGGCCYPWQGHALGPPAAKDTMSCTLLSNHEPMALRDCSRNARASPQLSTGLTQRSSVTVAGRPCAATSTTWWNWRLAAGMKGRCPGLPGRWNLICELGPLGTRDPLL